MVKGQSVHTGELGQTDRQIHWLTNVQTDGHYQVHYLPATRCLAIDKKQDKSGTILVKQGSYFPPQFSMHANIVVDSAKMGYLRGKI